MKYTILQAEVKISDESEFLGILRDIGTENKVYITFFDADYIAGAEHIKSAFLHALRAFCSGNNISRTPDMEVLLYAAGIRQCSCAVQTGLKKGVRNYYILIFDMFDLPECSDEVSVLEEGEGEGNCGKAERGSSNSVFCDDSSSPDKCGSSVPDFFMQENLPVIQRCFLRDTNFPAHFFGVLENFGASPGGELKSETGLRNFFEGRKSGLRLNEADNFLIDSEGNQLREFFGISDEEINAAGTEGLADLVLERVALLEINR